MINSEDRIRGRNYLAKELGVSKETLERYEVYVALLCQWQKIQNLVSRETLPNIWTRHICDSVQPFCLVKGEGSWIDIGSGAGFPGLVIAILLADQDPHFAASSVNLVESNRRKTAFLRKVVREAGIKAQVHSQRIEEFEFSERTPPNYITARACAPLTNLLSVSERFVQSGATCYFHKGKEIAGEIRDAANMFEFDLIQHKGFSPDKRCEESVIVEIRTIRRLLP